MRILIKTPGNQNGGPSIICATADCRRGTKHGKTYCSNHIDNMDYVKALAAEHDKRDVEVELLAQGKDLPQDSHLVKEAFALLWEYRSISAPGLTRHIPLDHDQAERLLRNLRDRGLVSIAHSPRGLEATCLHDGNTLPQIVGRR